MGQFSTSFKSLQRVLGFKSSKLKYYLWSDLSQCYLGDECVVVVAQGSRQDVSVMEEEVWVLQRHRSLMRWMQD